MLSALAGCGGAVGERAAVSGNVSCDGTPLEQGQVVFEPRGPGRMAIGQVVNGRYAIAAERGPTPGEYVIRITGSRTTGQKASVGSMAPGEVRDVYEQFLPSRYNDTSELEIQISTTDPIEKDFDLQSK